MEANGELEKVVDENDQNALVDNINLEIIEIFENGNLEEILFLINTTAWRRIKIIPFEPQFRSSANT